MRSILLGALHGALPKYNVPTMGSSIYCGRLIHLIASRILNKKEERAKQRQLAIALWVAGAMQPLPPDVKSTIESEIGPEPDGLNMEEKLVWARKFNREARWAKWRRQLPHEVVSALEAEVDANFHGRDEDSSGWSLIYDTYIDAEAAVIGDPNYGFAHFDQDTGKLHVYGRKRNVVFFERPAHALEVALDVVQAKGGIFAVEEGDVTCVIEDVSVNGRTREEAAMKALVMLSEPVELVDDM